VPPVLLLRWFGLVLDSIGKESRDGNFVGDLVSTPEKLESGPENFVKWIFLRAGKKRKQIF
jgi:hypothetical protein